MKPAPSPLTRALTLAIRGYQRSWSVVFPPSCRYWPSCSEYAIEALQLHGPARGGWLALERICRCHPWGGHGIDPVPGSVSAMRLASSGATSSTGETAGAPPVDPATRRAAGLSQGFPGLSNDLTIHPPSTSNSLNDGQYAGHSAVSHAETGKT